MDSIIQTIVDTFENRGNEIYGDEAVTQMQHALQCAQLARQNNESHSLVAAALLHDIGHILGEEALPPDCSSDLDDRHETVGHDFLSTHFGDAVAEPVRLHVDAKRYLCTKHPEYRDQLSPTSLKSFLDQGGEMDPSELQEFENNPFFEEAIRLRRWDDLAKDPEDNSSTLSDYLNELRNVLSSRQEQSG